jgi:hypothetical protein
MASQPDEPKDTDQPTEPAAPTKPLPKRRRRLKLGLAIGIPILLFATAWASLILSAKQVNMADPVAVATQFLSDVSTNRPHNVYSLLTTRYQQKVSYDDFTKSLTTPYARLLAGRQPLVYVNDLTPGKDSNKQTVLFNFSGNDDPGQTKYCALVTLTKDKGQWHVSAYEVSQGQYSTVSNQASH